MSAIDHNTGIHVTDLLSNAAFLGRERHLRNAEATLAGMQRISRALLDDPQSVLQVLSEVAVSVCDADSAGVSIETVAADGQPAFRWAATAGLYLDFLDAMLPREWMPCGICLDRNRPQLVRVPAEHFLAMEIEGVLPITDGMLIPWLAGNTRGTVWILAHERLSAFDNMDYKLMQMFADFAAMASRHQQQQEEIVRRAAAASAASMAHALAHQINNPLQKITNSVFLAALDTSGAPLHLQQAEHDLGELATIVRQLLTVSRTA